MTSTDFGEFKNNEGGVCTPVPFKAPHGTLNRVHFYDDALVWCTGWHRILRLLDCHSARQAPGSMALLVNIRESRKLTKGR